MPSLDIHSSGILKGGSLTYAVTREGNVDTIIVGGHVKAGVGWFVKDYPFSSSYASAAGDFAKARFKTPGQVIAFPAGVQITVLDCDGALAHCHVEDSQVGLAGIAVADVSGVDTDPVVLKHVEGQATVKGYLINLVADQA